MNAKEYTDKALHIIKHPFMSGVQFNGRNIYTSKEGWFTITNPDNKIITCFECDPVVVGYVSHLLYFFLKADKIHYKNNLIGKYLNFVDLTHKDVENNLRKLGILSQIAYIFSGMTDMFINGHFNYPIPSHYYRYILDRTSKLMDAWYAEIKTIFEKHSKPEAFLENSEYEELKYKTDLALANYDRGLSPNDKTVIPEAFDKLISIYDKLSEWQQSFTKEVLSDDAHYTVTLRENISYYNEYCGDFLQGDLKLLSRIHKIDSKTIRFVKASSHGNKISGASKYQNSHWWWHLDELYKLSKDDLKTI